MIRTMMQVAMVLPDDVGEGILEQETRRRLVEAINEHPGLHASQLARELEEPWGTIQYHLSLLRKADLVRSVASGRERRFFPGDIDPIKARLLSLLEQGRRPEIAHYVNAHPGSRQVDICKALGVSRKTFRSSIQPLVDQGLITERKGLHSNRYYATEALEPVADVLEPYDVA